MQQQLFTEESPIVIKVKPKFKHSYIAPCTFLGTLQGHDLYHSILKDSTPMLLERYGDGHFEFNGENSRIVSVKYDDDTFLGFALQRAKNLKLKV
jgi:hypothetical protein